MSNKTYDRLHNLVRKFVDRWCTCDYDTLECGSWVHRWAHRIPFYFARSVSFTEYMDQNRKR